MALLDSDTTTMTGAVDVIQLVAGGGPFAAQFDLSNMVAGNTVIIRWSPEFLDTAVEIQTQSWEIVHGTTTSPDWVGTFGTEAQAFDTGIIWTPGTATLSIEQTVGTLIDVPWQIWAV